MAKPKLKEVEVKDAPARLVWVDPASLAEHPDNWKIHTEHQTAVVSDLIKRHGWLVPLTYNLTTGRLLNGHDRRKLAVAEGIPAVPVWVGSWPKESEAEILFALDQSGQLFECDKDALSKVLGKVEDVTDHLELLMAEMRAEYDVEEQLRRFTPAARPEPTFTAEGSDGDGPGDGSPASSGTGSPPASGGPTPGPGDPGTAPTPSHVRMVQLFLNVETYPQFYEMTEKLGANYGTMNPTDTVMECLRRAHDGLSIAD